VVRLLKASILSTLVLLACQLAPASGLAGIRFQTELVRVKTVDNVWLTGLLRYSPSAQNRVGLVMIHGYGGNFYSDIMAFLPEALSRSGFATLALNMRDHDLGPKRNRFEENRYDIAAAVDEMARRGYGPLVLYGHSMGTNRVLYYLADKEDRRIMGAVLTGPPGNLFQWNVRVFGKEKATDVLRRAQQLVAQGKGGEWMLIDLGPLGKALYTADHVVSLRGPETFSDPFKNIARVSKPILIVHGSADRLADPAVADMLRDSSGSGSVTVLKIPGAEHRFSGCEAALTESIVRWLSDHLNAGTVGIEQAR
jgi:acylglycerol lipase